MKREQVKVRFLPSFFLSKKKMTVERGGIGVFFSFQHAYEDCFLSQFFLYPFQPPPQPLPTAFAAPQTDQVRQSFVFCMLNEGASSAPFRTACFGRPGLLTFLARHAERWCRN